MRCGVGEVLNKGPEQRHTCSDTVGSFLGHLPSIRIREAQQKRVGSEKGVRHVGIDDRRSGNIGESDGPETRRAIQ